jgi:hypothetical protein
MKLNDEKTRSVAGAVSDVLEGKKPKKEEAKYPHDMFHPETGEKVVAKTEKDHEELSKKGYTHEKPKMESPEEPRAKGEKEFKAKHKVKKSGEKEDGTVVKEKKVDEVLGFDKENPHKDEDEKEKEKKEGNAFTKALNAARKNGDDEFVVSGKKYKVEDYDKDEEDEVEETYSPAMVKKAVDMAKKSGGQMTPVSKKIEAMKKGLSDHPKVSAAFKAANEDVEITDEVIEEAHEMNEAEDKKSKYKAFFDKALKKFGVSSPAELKGEKKKEFFDYVDANYEAENETD